jgi:hypothetical protein
LDGALENQNLLRLHNFLTTSLNQNRMATITSSQSELPLNRIFKTWWPLAASWLLMGIELPAVSATMARLADPEINLAAYGGVVFPLSLIVEAPIIMLLAASTALSKDKPSYIKVRRFMMVTSGILTCLHILIAFSPLYYLIVERILGVPEVIIEPARIGLMIMTPWTSSIAYRRFNQGVLIRFGQSQAVGIGTVIRLTADALVLVFGLLIASIDGIIVATSAVIAGVICEAVYSRIVVKPIVEGPLENAPIVKPPLDLSAFLKFYVPLAMTSLLFLLTNPIISAAVSRMPQALDSLAVWPVISGLIFIFRSPGMAYNEVVVALLDEPRSSLNLRKFALYLSLITSGLLLFAAITPVANFWFGQISALTQKLSQMAQNGLWLAILIPASNVWQSWYQGVLVYDRKTRGITEAVLIYLIISAVLLSFGAIWGQVTGLYFALSVFTTSVVVQTVWLWFRSRPVLEGIYTRDRNTAANPMTDNHGITGPNHS